MKDISPLADMALTWTAGASNKMLTGVQEQDLEALRALFSDAYSAPSYSMDDIYGWTSSGNTPVMLWEEGPEDWVFHRPLAVREYCEARGLRLEPVNHFALAVYSS
jgi:hypothetical protein